MRAESDRPIVTAALTGWGQDEHRARAREAGFDQHLVKPADPDQLRLLLHQASRKLPRSGGSNTRKGAG